MSKRPSSSVPRESPHRRTIRFTEPEFRMLGALAGAGGVTRSKLVHAVVGGWLKYVAASQARRGGTRMATLPFCCHAETEWVRYEKEPPWCPRCARPCCPACRRFYRLKELRCDGDGDGIGIYSQVCGCAERPSR